ncbi:hypothetical protein LACWKB8_1492 [Lactobacillus sp. wkB8]|nr:hypothetical protein LACWKB8_1492 [Lactobacillus sp. wkB8]
MNDIQALNTRLNRKIGLFNKIIHNLSKKNLSVGLNTI